VRGISALGNVDHDRVARAHGGVVRDQLRAQPADLDAHGRVDVGVEISAAIEHLDAQRVALQPRRVARERGFDDAAQQALLARRVAPSVAFEHARQLVVDRALLRFAPRAPTLTSFAAPRGGAPALGRPGGGRAPTLTSFAAPRGGDPALGWPGGGRAVRIDSSPLFADRRRRVG
jgi:N-acetylmuramate 1-kinase